MKHALFIFSLILSGIPNLMAGGHHDAIQSYIKTHHPTAKHIQLHETGEGLVIVFFTDHDLRYKIGFDQSNRPCSSEVEIASKNLPLAIQNQLPAGIHVIYIAYNSTATRHFYSVEYNQGAQHFKRFFNENGTELKH